MTSGLIFDPTVPSLSLLESDRVVMALGRTFVEFLTSDVTYSSVSVPFGDVTKGNAIVWEATNTQVQSVPPLWGHAEIGTAFITVPPQEIFDVQVLDASVPAGANYFAGFMQIERTTDPTSTWLGLSAPAMMAPENVDIPIKGGFSLPVEATIGFARMLHLYIDSGQLVIGRQTSVSVGPPGGTWSTSDGHGGSTQGQTTFSTGGQGIPAYQGSTTTDSYGPNIASSAFGTCNRGGGSDPSVSISTNWASTFTITVTGRYGHKG